MSNAKRWLPTATPAIIAGLLAAAITYGLHAVGIIISSNELAAVLTPIVGFLVAAIVQPPKQ
jgi:uncharacterized membrane protein